MAKATLHPQGGEVESQTHARDFRAAVEALDEAFFRMSSVRDTGGRLIDFEYDYCNQAALNILGRQRQSVEGQRVLDLFPTHGTNGLFDAYARVTETGEPLRYEFAFDENGVTGDFEISVSRVGDGHVVLGHDITERKRNERELALLAEQLQGALTSRVAIEQAKGYIAAAAGVDTNTAFVAMRRYARDHNRRLQDVARDLVDGELVDLMKAAKRRAT
jgi:PAS domain S-box-containing protein